MLKGEDYSKLEADILDLALYCMRNTEAATIPPLPQELSALPEQTRIQPFRPDWGH